MVSNAYKAMYPSNLLHIAANIRAYVIGVFLLAVFALVQVSNILFFRMEKVNMLCMLILIGVGIKIAHKLLNGLTNKRA